jgi:hypothetical protein
MSDRRERLAKAMYAENTRLWTANDPRLAEQCVEYGFPMGWDEQDEYVRMTWRAMADVAMQELQAA